MSLNTQNLQSIINFIWTVADDVLINKFLENQYQDVILPMTVLRRLDLALEPTKDKVLKTHNEFKSKIDNLTGLLTSDLHGSGLAFYNTSPFTMKKLLADPKNIDANFLDYLNGFSENVQDIITKFKFRNQLKTFEETGITFSLIEKFCNPKVELSPDKISPMAMGYMFEDLIRRFNEKTNAAAGRHFTPREIIELMTHLVYLPVKDKIQKGTFLVYDPCAGSGAMLTQSKLFATDPEGEIKSTATFHLYGQENTGEMYATCKSDMLLKNEDPDKIKFGSTLSEYGFDPDLKFNFMLTNPPYGTTWKQDIDNLNVGTGRKVEIKDRRFNLKIKNFKGELEERSLTSRSNDGQLMFMLHMLSKMKDPKDGGSRIASVHNGCIGGGVDIITACDMRYCSEDAYFVIKEIDLGMVADIGTLQRLPKIIAPGMAAEMAYTGRNVSGDEAKRIGLVNECYDSKETMMKGVMDIAKAIASKSPLSIRGTKEVLRYTRDHTVDDALNYISTWNAAMLISDDLTEAFRATMEKRPPRFKD